MSNLTQNFYVHREGQDGETKTATVALRYEEPVHMRRYWGGNLRPWHLTFDTSTVKKKLTMIYLEFHATPSRSGVQLHENAAALASSCKYKQLQLSGQYLLVE